LCNIFVACRHSQATNTETAYGIHTGTQPFVAYTYVQTIMWPIHTYTTCCGLYNTLCGLYIRMQPFVTYTFVYNTMWPTLGYTQHYMAYTWVYLLYNILWSRYEHTTFCGLCTVHHCPVAMTNMEQTVDYRHIADALGAGHNIQWPRLSTRQLCKVL